MTSCEASWREGRIYESKQVAVIFEALERDFDHNEMADFSEVTVEHIMPQTLTPAWIELLGPEFELTHAKWLHTLGTLTLTGYNPSLSNRPFKEKKEILAESHLELNNYFSKVESWGPAEIAARANHLLASGKSIWPRPQATSNEMSAAAKSERSHDAAFHADCIRAVEKHLNVKLIRLSQRRYSSSDDRLRVTCAVSKEYDRGVGPYYWFGFPPSFDRLLSESESGYACFGCGSAENIVLIPISFLHEHLGRMSLTLETHWHTIIERENQNLSLRLMSGHAMVPLNQFKIEAYV
jgi:hypothetical protein